jgi:hypothetical protein
MLVGCLFSWRISFDGAVEQDEVLEDTRVIDGLI